MTRGPVAPAPLPALLLVLAAAGAAGAGTACRDARPAVPSACAAMSWECGGGTVRVRRVADGGRPLSGPDAAGVGEDVVLENDRVAAVIDALDAPHLLSPTGGTLLDLGPVGGVDELNQLYLVAGVLPDDAFHYTEMEIVDESPRLVAVVLRGRLDGRADVTVATRYELRPCEPGVRVRSELYNGSPEPFTFFVGDVAYWGGRGPLPFAAAEGQGFTTPRLSLLDLDASWGAYPYVVAAGTATQVALVSCSRDRLEGVNDKEVTAVGEPRAIVRPGERVVYERFVLAAAGPDVEAAVRLAREARARLGRRATYAVSVRGRVRTEPPGHAPRAEVLIAPWTQVAPGPDGRFLATVPLGARARAEVWQFGRPVTTADLVAAPGADLGELVVPAPGRLRVTVAADPALVAIVPADAATRDAVTGTQFGRHAACAPWLGPPHGGSPACNRALVAGEAWLDVPAGRYLVYATIGPFGTLDRAEVTVAAGEVVDVALAPLPLPELAPGLLSADLHVHGAASFDSSIPDEDRVRSFLALGVDVLAATDHDVVVTYRDAIDALGAGGRVVVLPGVETTGLIPFLDVPDDPFPRVIGHFNFWPVEWDGALPRGGAPWDELVEPGALFDRMAARLAPGGLAMLNHPYDEPMFGRDLGYLRAVKYDPRKPVPPIDDGTRAGMLARRPAGGRSNLDFDVIEVLNGPHVAHYLAYRAAWWSFLSQGIVRAGAANSDSHGLTDATIGTPRNLVATGTTLAAFDDAVFDADVRAGRLEGTNGPVIDARLDGRPFGLEPFTPSPDARLELEVRAAPWIPVTEVRVVVNGRVVATLDALPAPADPFGADGLVRYRGSIALADLLPAGGGDAWLLVEAGLPLPLAADLDDDGVVDTSDNDGDGDVDLADVAAGEDVGPLASPADPRVEDGDPRFHLTAVMPGTWPLAFTNPWLLDVDGDGAWEAPGL